MSDTPRTDAAYTLSTGAGIYELFKESQELERELNAASKERDDALMMLGMYRMKSDEQKQRIKRLEEAYEGEIGEQPELLGSNVMGLLKRELNFAQKRIKRLEEAVQERDKEWFQVIESILGFHPVSMTEALRIGIERIKKQKQRIKRLEEAGDVMAKAYRQICYDAYENQQVDNWFKAKEAKP